MLTILLWVLTPVYLFVYAAMFTLTYQLVLRGSPEAQYDGWPEAAAALWPLGLPLFGGAMAACWLLDRPRMPRARIIDRSHRND